MKTMTKLLALVMAVLMVLTMASCGGAKTVNVKVIDIALTDELYAFGVDKDNAELQKQVNDFVKEIKEDGTLDDIMDKYFGDGEKTPVKSAKEDSTKDQLVIATNAAFAPFEYIDGDSYYGIDMELMMLLAKKLNKELVIKNVEFDSVCTNVDNGYADIAAAGLTVNPQRTEFVTFSESYYTASQMLVVKEDETAFDDCKTAEDVTAILNKLTKDTVIGAQTGTTGEFFTKGDADWGFDGFPVTCKGYSNGAMAVQDMINGNIDYVMIDEAPAKSISKSFNDQNS